MNRTYLLFLILIIACDNNYESDPIPIIDFPDVNVNLSLPEYRNLNTDGSFVLINNAGIRGIILYRENSSSYIAFERNCTYLPSDACATVDVDASSLYMKDTCCGSTFSFPSGSPSGGPARYSLRIYETRLDGNQLTITDDPVN